MVKKTRHKTNNYRKISKKTANGIIDRFKYLESTLPAQCNSTVDSRIKKYPKILNILPRAVHLFGRQKLALTGNCESIANQEISNNPGHFIAFVKEILSYIVQN